MAARSGRRALLMCSLRKFLGQQGLKRINITNNLSSSSLSVRSFRSAAGGRMFAKRRVGVSYTRSKDSTKGESESDGYVKGGTSSQNGAAGEAPQDESSSESSPSFFERLIAFMKKHRVRIITLSLAAIGLTSTTRLWGERIKYEMDMKDRDERIKLLTQELQGRFDLEYESLDALQTERQKILQIVDKFAASWPASRAVDPKSAQELISGMRTDMDTWFTEKEAKLIPKDNDAFVKAGDGKGFTGMI